MYKTLLFWTIISTAMMHTPVWAQSTSPIGLWKSIDDDTGKPSALIRITEIAGEFRGRIVKIFPDPGEPDNSICNLCEGKLKDQPVIGLIILYGMRREGGEYTGGQILDPDNGVLYRCRMVLSEDGSKLNIRGYVGVPMLGRTQIWLREE